MCCQRGGPALGGGEAEGGGAGHEEGAGGGQGRPGGDGQHTHISIHIYTYLNTYLHILGQDIQADAGRHTAALQAEPRHKGHVTRDTSTVIYVIILSNGAGGLKSSTSSQ